MIVVLPRMFVYSPTKEGIKNVNYKLTAVDVEAHKSGTVNAQETNSTVHQTALYSAQSNNHKNMV